MNTQVNTELTSLSEEEILCVGGAIGVPGSMATAIDRHGHKISMEEFMDRQLKAKGVSEWVWNWEYDGTDPFEILLG